VSRSTLLRALAPLLLVAVACGQIALAQTRALAPWLGGGFGMFSTTDTWMRRHLHAFALRPGVRRELALPPGVEREVRRAVAFPSDAHLRALARRLAAAPSSDEGPLEGIEIQVWGVRYGADLAPAGVLLRGVRIQPSAWENA
jgi:hypothetical protein